MTPLQEEYQQYINETWIDLNYDEWLEELTEEDVRRLLL